MSAWWGKCSQEYGRSSEPEVRICDMAISPDVAIESACERAAWLNPPVTRHGGYASIAA